MPTDSELLDYVYANFGFLAWAIDIPDLKSALFTAAQEKAAPARLEALVQGTAWWKNTTATSRIYIHLGATDPGEFARQRQAFADVITAELASQGVTTVSIERIYALAQTAMWMGSDEAALRRSIRSEIPFENRIRQDYGPLAAFIGHPEIDPLLRLAYEKDWTPQVLQAEVEKTNWFKSTSAPTREWVVLTLTDPATATGQIEQMSSDVRALSQELGLGLSDAQITQATENALRFGWDSDYLQRTVRGMFEFEPATVAGEAALTLDAMKTQAKQFAVPLGDEVIEDWIEKIVRGQAKPDEFGLYLKTAAKSQYPWLASAIDQGFTVEQYADPFKQVAARTLGISPTTIDLSQPKWNRSIAFVDPKTNEKRPMDLWEWERFLRTESEYGWTRTPGAQEEAYELGLGLVQSLGRRR